MNRTRRSLAIVNHKGGVGKTTTAVNLCHALALQGHKVLAIDLDPQAQLTASLGADANFTGMDAVLLEDRPMNEAIQRARDNVDLITAGNALRRTDHSGETVQLRRLSTLLAGARLEADWIIMDSPPSGGLLGLNALIAATDVLMPVSSDYLALHGLSNLVAVLASLKSRHNHTPAIRVLITRFQRRRRLAAEVEQKLLKYFPGQVLRTKIHEAAVLSECPGAGQTVFEYRPGSRSAEEYSNLALDLVNDRVLQQ